MSHYCRRYDNGLLDLAIELLELENITKRNVSESPLLRLPDELRNHVWSQVLADINIEISLLQDQGSSTTALILCSPQISPTGQYSPSPSPFLLPLVCRAFYTEISALLYRQVRFCFDFASPTADPRTMKI
jgi:hypothetical protein